MFSPYHPALNLRNLALSILSIYDAHIWPVSIGR
jgi:hypothetical protein